MWYGVSLTISSIVRRNYPDSQMIRARSGFNQASSGIPGNCSCQIKFDQNLMSHQHSFVFRGAGSDTDKKLMN